MRDGVKIGVADDMRNHSTAYMPGDIEKVKKVLGREQQEAVKVIEGMWSPDVVAKYKSEIEAQEKEL